MSVWKSPVFYFGILLVGVIAILLAAPYVVSWNGYKGNLEAYGNRLTGRNVQIGGDVEIRLFPWPRLTAQNVAIGNPDGFDGAPLLHTDVLTLSLQLGGLLNGNLNVESVELQEPRVTLIRNADGAVNWMLASDEDLRRSSLLSNVRLDQIQFSNASIRLDDRKQGVVTDLSTIDADMSAAAIEGPWRLRGTGYWREMPMAFTFSSTAYEQGGPFKFGLRVTPGDTVLPAFSIDGGWQDAGFDGDVAVTPQASDGQKSSVEGGFRPLAMKAKLKATAERADLSEIRIAPADIQDSGTLIEGSAGIDLGNVLRGEVKLKSPRANLDTLLGAESLATWRSGGPLALAHTLLRNLPAKLDAQFALDVTVLTAGGETMNDVRLAAHVTPEGIRIDNARAGLPGRSAIRMVDGLVSRKDGAAELSGELAFESSDLRAFAGWALPQHKAGFDGWWKGSRGRLKLKSAVAWSQSQLALRTIQYELEGLPGQGDVTLRQGDVPSLDVNLRTPGLDLDSFLAGDAVASGARAFDILGYLDPVLRGTGTMERHLTLDAGSVTLNGVRAQDVALDVAASQSGFEIKAFDIGSVGGARLKAEGLVLSKAEGPSGDITASLVANDPSGFLRLAGLSGSNASWVRSLGQTDVSFKFNARPDANGPVLTYTLDGTAAPFTLALSGGITELERGSDARVTLDGTVTAPDAARLLSLAGLTAKVQGAGAGKVTLGFSGARSGGFASKVAAEAYGARLTFDGSLKPGEAYAAMSGAASLFADDVGPLLRAVGVPQADGPGGNLRLAFKVTPEDGGLAVSDVVGDHAGLALAGEGKFDAAGKLAADFNTGDTSLLRLLALSFAPWHGGEVDLGTTFARPEDLLFDGEIWLRPRTLAMPYGDDLTETAIGITLGKTRRLVLLAPTRPELEFSLAVEAQDTTSVLSGKGKLPLDLGRMLVAGDATSLGSGALVISGELKGAGRSPAAALAELEGHGVYTLSSLAFTKLAPEAFAARLPQVKSSEELRAALDELEASPGLVVESSGGSFTIAKGVLTATLVRVSGIGTLSEVTAVADFTERRLEVKAAVTLTGRPELPSVSVTYSGVPGALERRASSSALASKLGHELLAKDLAELERLKTEQEKLAVAEEEQRQQDVAKFEAYQAQRAEIRMRQRELKVHAASRAAKAALAAAEFEAFVPVADGLNKVELAKQRLRAGVKPRLAAWAEENARKKLEEEERQRALAEKLRLEEEARLKKIEDEKAKAEAARLKAIADEEARIAAEKAKAEEDARKAEAARVKAEAAAKALEEEKARQAAEKKKREEEALRKLQELPVSPVVPQQPVPPCEGIYC